MARWKLLSAHYLNVPGVEWEYRETTREGKQGRKIFTVPQYLDPKDPADWNYPELGEIIVSDGKGKQQRDIIFVGPPTPEMEPLDDDATKVTDLEKAKWVHPIESLDTTYSASLLKDLERQVADLQSGQRAAPVVVKGIDPADFAKLQEQVAALMAQNAELQSQVAGRRKVG